MELTNAEVQDVVTAIRVLSTERVPAKFAWKVQVTRKTLEPFFDTLLNSIQEIQLKYAARTPTGDLEPGVDEDGQPLPNTIRIPPKDVAAANKELRELLEAKIHVENVGFPLHEIPDTLEITPDTMLALSPIILA